MPALSWWHAGIMLCFVSLLGFAGVYLSQYTVGQKMLTLYALLMALMLLLVLIAAGVLVGAVNNLVRRPTRATCDCLTGTFAIHMVTSWQFCRVRAWCRRTPTSRQLMTFSNGTCGRRPWMPTVDVCASGSGVLL